MGQDAGRILSSTSESRAASNGSTPPVDPARAKLQRQVAQAFALGWHVEELYRFEILLSPPSKAAGSSPKSLPGISGLTAAQRKDVLIRQVKFDLKDLWDLGDGNPPLTEVNSKLDALRGATDTFVGLVDELHRILLEALTIADFRLGKSYNLGRSLGEAVITAGAAKTSNELRDCFRDCLSTDAVFDLQASLLDLRDWYAKYAADAVSTTLGAWSLWSVRPTIDGKKNVRWNEPDDFASIKGAIKRQGDMWRGLLSGEKDPANIAGADAYFRAMASVVRRMSLLAVRFLTTAIGFLLFILVIVAGLALWIAASSPNNSGGVLGAVVALLGALGVTTGSVGASVKQAWSKAESPLWEAEVSQAIAQAAWKNPAPLGSIEQIQLLMAIGEHADARSATKARHPKLYAIRNLPVGRLGIVLIVVSVTASLFAADAGHLNRDASFFLPPLVVVTFLVAIDAWDLLIGVATRRTAPYLALPERIELAPWIMPVAQWLAPIFLVTGVLAGHFFWH